MSSAFTSHMRSILLTIFQLYFINYLAPIDTQFLKKKPKPVTPKNLYRRKETREYPCHASAWTTGVELQHLPNTHHSSLSIFTSPITIETTRPSKLQSVHLLCKRRVSLTLSLAALSPSHHQHLQQRLPEQRYPHSTRREGRSFLQPIAQIRKRLGFWSRLVDRGMLPP
jgi:hypothetical protein